MVSERPHRRRESIEAVPGELTQMQRDLLRLCTVPRRTGDIAFLYRESGRDSTHVGQCLAELEMLGWVTRSENELWSQTDDGLRVLRRAEEWEVVVDDVFHITGRPRPVITGTLRRGSMYIHDFCLVNGERLASVLSIEFPCGPEVEDAVGFTLDIDVRPGDVLTWHEPYAA